METRVNKICPKCNWVTCECANNSNCCNAPIRNNAFCSECGEQCVTIEAADMIEEQENKLLSEVYEDPSLQ